VAIKMPRQNNEEQFEKEVRHMMRLHHDNIIRLLGWAYFRNGPGMVLEYAQNGTLHSLVHGESKNASPSQSTSSATDTCTQYLLSQHVLHRDLAARNCLLTGDDDGTDDDRLLVKISDFGMSRTLYADYYRLQELRWLAPESLLGGRFTHHSDMWAFGVLLWEIFSHAQVRFTSAPLKHHVLQVPHAHLSNEEVLAAAATRSPATPIDGPVADSPAEVRTLMRQCWQ
ncbi:unnamed protein product, partial [Sphagnum balticum]